MAIERERVMQTLFGPIPAFGAFVNQLPAALWNGFAGKQTDGSGSSRERAEHLPVNASRVSGCGHGFIVSEKWKAEQAPRDILRGAFAVRKTWGWADSEVVELVPRERPVVRAGAYYKSDADGLGTFRGVQTKGTEYGDERGEFVVTGSLA